MLNISEFLIVMVETAYVFKNFDVKYAGAHLVTHLNTKTTRRKYSCCLTGSQRKPFNKGVMYLSQEKIDVVQSWYLYNCKILFIDLL